MAKLMFHVRHNARPCLVKEILQTLEGNEPLDMDDILETGRQRGFQIGTKVRSVQSLKENPIQTSRDLGLIADDAFSLTHSGRQIVDLLQYKPAVFSEVMHVLHYTLWTPVSREENCFSWSYRTACDQLWESGSITIDRGQLASYVSETAMEKFDTSRVSFSKDSLRGVLQWLAMVQPPVLDKEGKAFTRRAFCPPETFVLAVDFLYRMEGAEYQTNLLLDPKKQERICKVCLLEPTAFDSAFDWAAGQYEFLQRGTSGGWGSYILLTRQPQIQHFVG